MRGAAIAGAAGDHDGSRLDALVAFELQRQGAIARARNRAS